MSVSARTERAPAPHDRTGPAARTGGAASLLDAIADGAGTPVTLRRAPTGAPRGGAGARPPGWVRRVLSVPLGLKLIGANGLIALLAWAALGLTSGQASRADVLIFAGAILLGLALNCLLVHLALRPMWELERVAGRVWRGDLGARVPGSLVADEHLARVGRTFNLLLDSLEDDRERMRALATQTIRAQDDERSRIARELHDSTAQVIAALGYQLVAAARDAGEREQPDLQARLLELREQTGALLEEVRLLSHAIHPRVLDDLGLVPALEWLARQTREHTGLDVDVASSLDEGAPMSDSTAAALYRVAQESLRNVERHAGAVTARLTLRTDGDDVLLDVVDDGRGFDLGEALARRPGMGLFSMRERLALVGGALDVDTAPGRGTRVHARAPMDAFAPRLRIPFSPPPSQLR